MKRVIIAAVIILFSLSFALWEHISVDRTLTTISETLTKDSGEAYRQWQKKRDFLCIFLEHEDVDAIDTEMYALREYSASDDNENVKESIMRISGYIENIRQSEKLSFGNVF